MLYTRIYEGTNVSIVHMDIAMGGYECMHDIRIHIDVYIWRYMIYIHIYICICIRIQWVWRCICVHASLFGCSFWVDSGLFWYAKIELSRYSQCVLSSSSRKTFSPVYNQRNVCMYTPLSIVPLLCWNEEEWTEEARAMRRRETSFSSGQPNRLLLYDWAFSFLSRSIRFNSEGLIFPFYDESISSRDRQISTLFLFFLLSLFGVQQERENPKREYLLHTCLHGCYSCVDMSRF